MSIKVELLADSQNALDGSRLSTFKLELPLAAFVDIATHRKFSKNASSSRAIPLKTWRENALKNPAIPTELTKYKKGMAANEPLDAETDEQVRAIWQEALSDCAIAHEKLEKLGVSKQDANVLLYQFSHMQVILSATSWGNFFNLRCDLAAKPDVRICAEQMRSLLDASEPEPLSFGEWHTPLVSKAEKRQLSKKQAMKVSTARCARVSYLIPSSGRLSMVGEDIELHNRLVSMGHFSPLEHIATPFPRHNVICGNYVGFLQYRKLVEPNEVEEFPNGYEFADSAQAKNIAIAYGLDF